MTRRSALPTVALVAEAAQFPLNDATYSHITLNSYKYGYLTQ